MPHVIEHYLHEREKAAVRLCDHVDRTLREGTDDAAAVELALVKLVGRLDVLRHAILHRTVQDHRVPTSAELLRGSRLGSAE